MNFKKILVGLLIGCFVISCDDDLSDSNITNSNVPPASKYFDFATTQKVKVDFDFRLEGYISLIKLYKEYPYVKNEETGRMDLKKDLLPIYEVYTNKKNLFVGEIELPAMLEKVYLASDPFTLSDAVELTIEKGCLEYDANHLKEPEMSKAGGLPTANMEAFLTDFLVISQTRKLYGLFNSYTAWSSQYSTSHFVTNTRKNVYNVLPSNTPLTDESTIGEMMDRIRASVMSWNGRGWQKRNNEDKLRGSDIINLKVLGEVDGRPVEGAEVDLVFLKSSGSYHNTMCYYYYQTADEPTADELKALPKFVVFPRTTSGGLNRILSARLQYFGTDYNQTATDVFPPGVTIGWMMVPNMGSGINWYASGQYVYNNIAKYYGQGNYLYSNEEANLYGIGCMALYDAKSQSMVIGFEDQNYRSGSNDRSYEDILFYASASPVEAIETLGKAKEYVENGGGDSGDDILSVLPITEETPENTWTTETITGLLAFEDIWPSGGDYDMNDVVVRYKTEITFNQMNQIKQIVDTFIPIYDGARFINAFGYVINDEIGVGTIDEGASNFFAKESSNQIILYKNNKEVSLKPGEDESQANIFTVVRNFDSGSYPDKTIYVRNYNPFIVPHYEEGVSGRKEVHLPKKLPTFMANRSLNNTQEDAYYVRRDGKFPFAIDLRNVSNMATYKELVPIDVKYPRFSNWVMSNGTEDTDWYELEE